MCLLPALEFGLPGMRKHLQLALMAVTVIATSLSLTTPSVQAEADAGGIAVAKDGSGHTVYVNDFVATPATRGTSPTLSTQATQQRLVYWSPSEHRWKPVQGVTMRAARSAAAEVNRLLNRPTNSVAICSGTWQVLHAGRHRCCDSTGCHPSQCRSQPGAGGSKGGI